jgi:16S rRNA (guanine527-N7)-methyltransferase
VTEGEARGWIEERHGAAGVDAMSRLAALVRDEARRQNLIAPSTLDEIWARHIVDSAQLIPLAVACAGTWLDIGTGAGFPGLVVAALADFLSACCEALDATSRTTVVTGKVERLQVTAAVISARAVASLWELLGAARHCSTWNTLWLLPKGRSAREEIASAQQSWHGAFHVERSITDPESLIVIAKEVTRR